MKYRNIFLIIGLFLGVLPLYTLDIDATMTIDPSDDGYIVNVSNQEPFEVYLLLNFPVLEGLTPSQPFPIVLPIQPGDNSNIFILSKIPDMKRYSYSTKYGFMFANPHDVRVDDTVYFLPYEHGVKHRVTQGWEGTFSHSGQNKYAIDFDFDNGTEIYAARGGVVVAVKEDSKWGGPRPQYQHLANYIMIRHEDNTFGNYVHLQFNGALVDVGDIVEPLTLIGYSGATGYGSGPHLHFDVRIPTMDGVMQSIPFYFRDYNGNPVSPKVGHTYYSVFPEQPEFEIIRGEDITSLQYEDYIQLLEDNSPRDTIGLRQEVVDNVVILFVSNGFSTPVSTEIYLTLTNMEIQEDIPLNRDIPARSEVFLTLAYIKNLSKKIGVKSKFKFYLLNDE